MGRLLKLQRILSYSDEDGKYYSMPPVNGMTYSLYILLLALPCRNLQVSRPLAVALAVGSVGSFVASCTYLKAGRGGNEPGNSE